MQPWGPWRPDVGGPNTGVATTADGVLPQSAGQGGLGYGPMNSLVTATAAVALAGAPRGGIALQRQDGAWQVYFASAAKIQLLTSIYAWTDIETGRSVTTNDDVSFAVFGTYLLNTDTTDGFKAYNYEAGGTNSAVSGAPSSPREICVCNNVVFLLNVGGNNKRMQSSGQGDHTNWTTEGADGKTFEDGGALIAMRDLKNGAGLILQESAIRLVQFGSAPQGALYTISKVADGLGALSSRSTTAWNGTVWWLSSSGFYEYTAGGVPTPIGDQKVNTWLAGTLASTDYVNVQAAVDPARKMTWWRLSATTLIGYHWLIREFVTITVATSALTRVATPAVVIDDISTIIDNDGDIIDSLDLQGGLPTFGALDSSYKFARFTGTALAYTLQSCATSVGGSVRFVSAQPISDASTSTLSIGTTDSLAVAMGFSTPAARNEDGKVPLDDRGRHFAFKEAGAAGITWTYSNGVDGIESNPDAP